MSLEANCLPIFAGHQTFHPRFGWLKKGFDAVSNDPEVFSRPDAPVVLGVGKNMVEAIRFWGQAFKVITSEGKSSHSRSVRYAPTNFGSSLLGDNGLDPYLEDPTSLWLLHWMLCSPTSTAPAWWLFVNEFNPIEFSDDIFFEFLKNKIDSSMWKSPSSSSLLKDVDALLRMYTRRNAKGRQTIDDLLDSPFRDLGLILESATQPGHYRINGNTKPTLSGATVILAAMDYVSMFDPGAKTISFTRLAYEDNSPGKVFRIPLGALSTLIVDGALGVDGLKVANTGGVQQLMLKQAPNQIAANVSALHYQAPSLETGSINVIGRSARESLNKVDVFEVSA